MGFTRHDLLMAVIDDGITEIPLAYPRPDQAMKREGAIAGFEACRTLDDRQLPGPEGPGLRVEQSAQ